MSEADATVMKYMADTLDKLEEIRLLLVKIQENTAPKK